MSNFDEAYRRLSDPFTRYLRSQRDANSPLECVRSEFQKNQRRNLAAASLLPCHGRAGYALRDAEIRRADQYWRPLADDEWKTLTVKFAAAQTSKHAKAAVFKLAEERGWGRASAFKGDCPICLRPSSHVRMVLDTYVGYVVCGQCSTGMWLMGYAHGEVEALGSDHNQVRKFIDSRRKSVVDRWMQYVYDPKVERSDAELSRLAAPLVKQDRQTPMLDDELSRLTV